MPVTPPRGLRAKALRRLHSQEALRRAARDLPPHERALLLALLCDPGPDDDGRGATRRQHRRRPRRRWRRLRRLLRRAA